MSERFKLHTYHGETPHNRPMLMRDSNYKEKHPETTIEQQKVRELINSLDEQTLYDIFAAHFKKAGSDISTMNWIPMSEIVIVAAENETGEVDSAYGTYNNKKGIRLSAKTLSDDPANTLWTLIHEELHAISDTHSNIEKNTNAFNSYEKLTRRVGVENIILKKTISPEPAIENHSLYTAINEGLTELITQKIFQEYLRRSGDLHDPKFANAEKVEAVTYAMSDYGEHRKFAEFYIALLTIITDVPEATVEGALVRSYMRNGDILPQEIQQELVKRDSGLPHMIALMFTVTSDQKEPKALVPKTSDFIHELLTKNLLTTNEHARVLDFWGKLLDKTDAALKTIKRSN